MFDKDLMKKIRLEKGYTQKKLGELCEPPISESTIRRYELGLLKPKYETVQRIQKALYHDNYGIGRSLWIHRLDDVIFINFPGDEQNQVPIPRNQIGKDEHSLLADYRKLNMAGRKEAKKRISELTEIKKYTEFESLMTNSTISTISNDTPSNTKDDEE